MNELHSYDDIHTFYVPFVVNLPFSLLILCIQCRSYS
jgi:hypothetical protein